MKYHVDDLSYETARSVLEGHGFGLAETRFEHEPGSVVYAEIWSSIKDGEPYGFPVGYIARNGISAFKTYDLVLHEHNNDRIKIGDVLTDIARRTSMR